MKVIKGYIEKQNSTIGQVLMFTAAIGRVRFIAYLFSAVLVIICCALIAALFGKSLHDYLTLKSILYFIFLPGIYICVAAMFARFKHAFNINGLWLIIPVSTVLLANNVGKLFFILLILIMTFKKGCYLGVAKY